MDRRHFLLSSAAASQALFSQSPNDQVATAMIGVGNRGSYLLQAVINQPNARVVALCDNKPDRLDKAATTAAKTNPATTSDWHKIIDRKDVDAVFIATPPYLHAEMAIAALKAGKHVYCEKPIGTTPAEIRELLKTAKQTKRVFQAGQQMRSQIQLAEAVKKIHDGAIGDILFVKAQRHASADIKYDGTSGDWYFDFKKSGGYLVEQSVHNLDACNWAIGQHPTRAAGFGGINLHKNEPKGRDIMDHQSITYDYPNGAKLSFTQMVFHPRKMPANNQSINVYGSKGAVELLNSATFYSLDGEEQKILAEKVAEKNDAHITAFYNCVQKGAKSPSDITVGATAALTAILGNEVCMQGKVIHWKDLGVEV
ncbi:MAG TPA: Gfo/Idh/MocA family oxidoreductase [Bryobacteraceae bacterium]|nr:Gfo/Idh/MocA family oxidoreductase [Bryobacteraceae bacterium]